MNRENGDNCAIVPGELPPDAITPLQQRPQTSLDDGKRVRVIFIFITHYFMNERKTTFQDEMISRDRHPNLIT